MKSESHCVADEVVLTTGRRSDLVRALCLPGIADVAVGRIAASIRRFCQVFIVVSLALLFFAGCEPEKLATRGGELRGANELLRNRANDPRSNTGTLRYDSTADLPTPSEHLIRPGDQVQVMVWGYPEFNTTTTVKSYGTITLPLVGDVIAEGLTENQLAKTLKQRLSEYIKGDARVNISHVSMNDRISVMGAVNKQGNYAALGEISLIEVIADAGGTAADADLRHVKIIRKDRITDAEEINLQRYLESGKLEELPEIKPGDTVFVPPEENLIREIASYGQDILVLFGFFALLR